MKFLNALKILYYLNWCRIYTIVNLVMYMIVVSLMVGQFEKLNVKSH